MAGLSPLRRRTHAVILAGGAGERFWPHSRRHQPKPLLAVGGRETLLAATVERAIRCVPKDQVWLVCGPEHAAPMRREAGLPSSRTLVEPRRRNTAPAVALAATRIAARDPEALLVVLPADHLVPDGAAFARAIASALPAAAHAQVLLTLGVVPTRAETGYGYIERGPRAPGFPGLHRVRRFVEKPDVKKARAFVRRGSFLWNAGIFVWSARAILEEIEEHAPELHAALAPIRAAGKGPLSKRALEDVYKAAPSVAVDVAVLERSRRVWTLPVDFPWSDVGSWASLAEHLGVAGRTNRAIGGDVVFEDAHGNLVWSGRRTVALLGVEGLAVIETPDALLVARLDQSQHVRRIVDTLRARGREDLL
ncbi:MAG TPA: mannose-1-phosphate guanylyltransferase [Myxococcota bacterium]|nr:mannose-1-phosphate guanylyltransferase [Myxococcota bacterium]